MHAYINTYIHKFTVPYTYAHRFDYLHKDVKREVINAVV